MEYSERFIGELVQISKHVIALALDSAGTQTAIRLKDKSVFLILGLIEFEDNAPDSWKTMELYKILPMSSQSYDEFLFPVKSIPSTIFVDACHVSLWFENISESS